MHDDAQFDARFEAALHELFAWRRDVRHFKPDPLPADLVDDLVAVTRYAPSVGFSQPWRFVSVETPERRAAVIASFERANTQALSAYEGDDAALYARLKLSGLRESPVHLAVFCDRATPTGKGLGAQTMPETLDFSTVMAVHTLWLAARARGVGVGWVSILEPEVVHAALDVPEAWRLVAYLCLGYPVEYARSPELERAGWERRDDRASRLTQR